MGGRASVFPPLSLSTLSTLTLSLFALVTPETFEAELHTKLGRGYRLRWSHERKRWCVEQQVGRGALDHPGTSDKAIRLRDGYHLVLEMPVAPFVVCPRCYMPVPLPLFEKAEFTCEYCDALKIRHRFIDGYFPMVDKTIEYLEKWHPRRGAKALREELDRPNEALRASKQRHVRGIAESIALDGWRGVAGIKSTLDVHPW